MKYNQLLKKLGVEREVTSVKNDDDACVKSFLNWMAPKSLGEISNEEYLGFVKAEGMKSDGSELPEEERSAYLESLTDAEKSEILHRDRILTFRGSDETKDRHGDIVRVDGWDIKEFQDNPVFLSQHNSHKSPVGKALRVWKETSDAGAPQGKSLMFRIYFPTKAVSEEADAHFKLYKSGMMNGVSVGFRPLKMTVPQSPEAAASIGLGPYGVEFVSQKLLELSGVTIPANANALRIKGIGFDEIEEAIGLLQKSAEVPPSQEDGTETSKTIGEMEETIKELTAKVAELEKKFSDTIDEMKTQIENVTFKPTEDPAKSVEEPTLNLFELALKEATTQLKSKGDI